MFYSTLLYKLENVEIVYEVTDAILRVLFAAILIYELYFTHIHRKGGIREERKKQFMK